MGKGENTERAATQPCFLFLSGLSPLYFTKGTTMHVHKKRNEKKKTHQDLEEKVKKCANILTCLRI